MAANPEIVAYIRDAAIKRGIDPETALQVAMSEALNVFDPNQPDRGGDEGSSFGPYQLHYAGLSRNMPNAGLGDEFTAKTGLDARDPSTWKQQVDFSLDYAKANSWKPWMGASRVGIGARQGLGDTATIAPTPGTSVATPSVLTGKKGEEVWSKPGIAARHPQNPQVGTGGYVAPGAPGATTPATSTLAQTVLEDDYAKKNNPWSSLATGLASSVASANPAQATGGGDLPAPEMEITSALPAPTAPPGGLLGGELPALGELFQVDPRQFGQAAALNIDAAGQPIRRRQYG